MPRRQNLSPKLIWSLAHEPVWFGGVLAVTVGFLLQATALGNGELSVVEPILVMAAAVAVLGRSPLLSDESAQTEENRPGGGQDRQRRARTGNQSGTGSADGD